MFVKIWGKIVFSFLKRRSEIFLFLEIVEAQVRVEEMEKERKKLDKQLDHALEKAKAANHGQEVLETKIKVCA